MICADESQIHRSKGVRATATSLSPAFIRWESIRRYRYVITWVDLGVVA
jgi:hypothetical protein